MEKEKLETLLSDEKSFRLYVLQSLEIIEQKISDVLASLNKTKNTVEEIKNLIED